jgi:hypothetical protein
MEFAMIRKKLFIVCLILVALGLTILWVSAPWASYTKADKAIERISPEDARRLVQSGQALLVCSYSDNSCKSKMLEGALNRSELDQRLASLPKDTNIIFYCG